MDQDAINIFYLAYIQKYEQKKSKYLITNKLLNFHYHPNYVAIIIDYSFLTQNLINQAIVNKKTSLFHCKSAVVFSLVLLTISS